MNFKIMFSLMALIFTQVHSLEYGIGTGLGEQYGRAGLALKVQEGTFSASIAKHFAWSDYTVSVTNEFFSLGGNHKFTAGISLGHSFVEREAEKYRNRICLEIFDTHDFGQPSRFKAYYGFVVTRYNIGANKLLYVIPILGISYFFGSK